MKDEIEKIQSIKDIKEIFINLFPIFFQKKRNICIFSMCFYRLKKADKKKNFIKSVLLNDDKYKISTLFSKGIHLTIKNYTYYFNIYTVKINMDLIKEYPPQNLIKMEFNDSDYTIVMPVLYNLIHLKKYKGLTSKVYSINDDLVCYFRQAKLNSIAVTVRERNVTDKFSKRVKLFVSYFLSLITPKKDIILMYEKEANKYEESAAYTYERLIDLGYNNAYFIIGKDSVHTKYIKEKYQANIIYKHSFKHYYYFFKCHKFIGTESVPHALELRCSSKYVTNKFIKKDYTQVFLQHGVMYMVALDSRSRGAFRKDGGELPEKVRIVVSSKEEAKHFIDLGGFTEDELYVCGLPFYDRTIKKDTADKIVIMPTWRSWDYNLILTNYKKATYYKFCKKIIENIPKKYLDKVILLPHPLILNKFKNTDLNKYIPVVESYDKILEDTALLITDYSSIAYSAFYRGANVIFCWEELEECMKHYESHLMLNEKNAFGDITYDVKNIGTKICENYLQKQKTKYIKNYSKIVEFHDNKNTDRLIEYLKKDGII